MDIRPGCVTSGLRENLSNLLESNLLVRPRAIRPVSEVIMLEEITQRQLRARRYFIEDAAVLRLRLVVMTMRMWRLGAEGAVRNGVNEIERMQPTIGVEPMICSDATRLLTLASSGAGADLRPLAALRMKIVSQCR